MHTPPQIPKNPSAPRKTNIPHKSGPVAFMPALCYVVCSQQASKGDGSLYQKTTAGDCAVSA
ncbi:hypothetical protein EG327_010225 [Venturia inaequalis]|uniref:Uncharacterized protein n=1 Tax=Venturia inaequalis TaxID=5025 RepID=A0A8H3UJ45_VENIN|nr:hypothetical protein EG327_010225 [Venturia inaequalis]